MASTSADMRGRRSKRVHPEALIIDSCFKNPGALEWIVQSLLCQLEFDTTKRAGFRPPSVGRGWANTGALEGNSLLMRPTSEKRWTDSWEPRSVCHYE